MIKKNNKYIFETTRGDDFTLNLFFDKKILDGSCTLTSTIRRNEDSSEKISTSKNFYGDGKYELSFSASQMSDLHGTYDIDVELSNSYGNKKTIIIGSLIVNKDVSY